MDLPQKVRAPNPWAFFGYFLSQQKVTPRRGGETRQKTFRTRQDCEGADHRVAVKGNETARPNRQPPERSPGPQRNQFPQADTFKKRPSGPVLKDRQQKPKAPGAPRGWVTVSLIPAAACHFVQTEKERTALPFFL